MEFTKLKIDQYRVNSMEILNKSINVLKPVNQNQSLYVPIGFNLNNFPSSLVKFIKQLGYLEEYLAHTFKSNYNILSLGDIEYKEEKKATKYLFLKEVQKMFFNLNELNCFIRYPAANEFMYYIEVRNQEEALAISSKKFMKDLEILFIKFLDKLDLMYAVPLLSKKITLIKNEDTYFSLKIDFLADKCCIKFSCDKDLFDSEAQAVFKEKIDFIESETNKIYMKANLESHFKLLNKFEFMKHFYKEKKGYQRTGFNNAMEVALIEFLKAKHDLFENICNLELVSFTIDHEKSLKVQSVKEGDYHYCEKFILGYGQFTAKHIIDLSKNLENESFIHSKNMSSDFGKLLSISTPH